MATNHDARPLHSAQDTIVHLVMPDGGAPVVTVCGMPTGEMPRTHTAVTVRLAELQDREINCVICRVSEEGPGD